MGFIENVPVLIGSFFIQFNEFTTFQLSFKSVLFAKYRIPGELNIVEKDT